MVYGWHIVMRADDLGGVYKIKLPDSPTSIRIGLLITFNYEYF